MRDCCQLLIPKEQQLQQQPSNIGTGKSIQPQLKQFNQENSRMGNAEGPPALPGNPADSMDG